MKPFKVLEHTADIGIRAYGETLPRLFVNAATGMFSLIIGGQALAPKKIKAPYLKRKIVCEAPDVEALLIFWLSDLLYLYSTDEILFQDYDIQELTQKKIKAVCFGPNVHAVAEPKREIKAVTFHQASVKKNKQGLWESTVIFDI